MIPPQHGMPRYQAGQIIVEPRTGRRLLVLFVGIEAYFLRNLDWQPPDDPDEANEPGETAWVHAGCEAATHPEEQP